MKNDISKVILLSLSISLMASLGCGDHETIVHPPNENTTSNPEPTWTPDQAAVKATVEKFLVVAGNYDLEAMKEMITDKANLGVVRFQGSTWVTSTLTFDEYFEDAKSRQFTPYYEPVREYVIQMSEDQIAFVWADAILHQFGVPRSNNIDNFTLIKENGQWKFINISFTKKPLGPNEQTVNPEAFARGYSQAWSGRRPEFVAMHFAEDGILRVNDGAPAKGRNQITATAQGFMTDLPDMVVSFDSLVSKANGTEFHWTLTGTNSGPGGTGNKIKVSGYELWEISEDGLIKNSQGHFPSEEYNRQIEFGIDN